MDELAVSWISAGLFKMLSEKENKFPYIQSNMIEIFCQQIP